MTNHDATDKDVQKTYPVIPNEVDWKFLKDFSRVIPGLSGIMDEDGHIIKYFGTIAECNEIKSSQRLYLKDLLPNDLSERILQAAKEVLQQERMLDSVFECYSHGKRKIVECRLSSMVYPFEGRRMLAFHLADITARRRTEAALTQSYERQRRSDLINDIISGRIQPAFIRSNIALHRLDLLEPMSCLLIQLCEQTEAEDEKSQQALLEFQIIKDAIVDMLTERKAIAWNAAEGIGLFFLSTQPGNKQADSAFAREIYDRIMQVYPYIHIRIGISGFDRSYDLVRQYRQAAEAAQLCLIDADKYKVFHYDDIGMYPLLVRLVGEGETSRFVDKMLGRLLEYDQRNRTDFTETLEILIKSENIADAAKRLFIHRKTVVYRKKRIEEILELSLDEFDNKLMLVTALKLWRLREKEPKKIRLS